MHPLPMHSRIIYPLLIIGVALDQPEQALNAVCRVLVGMPLGNRRNGIGARVGELLLFDQDEAAMS